MCWPEVASDVQFGSLALCVRNRAVESEEDDHILVAD